MDRRTFLSGALGMSAALALPRLSGVAHATPAGSKMAADLPALDLNLTDSGFEIVQPLEAGRYRVTVSNVGTLAESHFALGKIPDHITGAQYEGWLSSAEGVTEALTFEAIAFVGVPDWPRPGGSVSGVVDIAPGRYFLFDPFSGREPLTLMVGGELVDAAEPAADVTVVLREMEIVLPETELTSKPVRWKIENTGAMSHEVVVLPVAPDFTVEHLQMMLTLPVDATPPSGVPQFAFEPAAAIGILASQHRSWLDIQLKPGRYLAACMLPFTTGYPHVMDGMYLFFDIK